MTLSIDSLVARHTSASLYTWKSIWCAPGALIVAFKSTHRLFVRATGRGCGAQAREVAHSVDTFVAGFAEAALSDIKVVGSADGAALLITS